MNLTPEQIAYLVAQGLALGAQIVNVFQSITGRTPTQAEFQSLYDGWESPDQLEADVHAINGTVPPAKA